MLYFTGDLHGEIIKRFSYKQNPELRNLTKDDIMIVLGDCGRPWFNPELKFYDYWTRPGSEKSDIYELSFLNSRPWRTIFICGNHENYDLIKKMPYINKDSFSCRYMMYLNKIYENIIVIDKPVFWEYHDKNILIIPGAESHDVDYIFEIDDPNTKQNVKKLQQKEFNGEKNIWYRINHFSWWKEEKINKKDIDNILQKMPTNKIDYILTHDAPAAIKDYWKKPGTSVKVPPTESELLLEQVRENIEYRQWIHGHFHNWIHLPLIHTLGIYHDIISEKEIEEIIKNDEIENKYNKLISALK